MLKPLFVALLVTTPVHADVVTFATRAAFNGASGPLKAQSFNRCSARTIAFAGPLDSGYVGVACPSGAVLPGLLIADAGPGGSGLYLAARGYAHNTSVGIGQNNNASDALVLDLASGTQAIGFDVYQNFGGGAQLGRAAPFDVQLWSGTTLLKEVTLTVPSGHGAFFGAISDVSAITQVTVNNALAYDLVGNITFRAQAAHVAAALVPEPASFALLCLASATLIRRRR